MLEFYVISKTMTQLTIITRSPEPFEREVPDGVAYLNHVSHFSTMREQSEQLQIAVKAVKTTHYMLVDTDDDIPQYLPIPDKGLLYGDFYQTTAGKTHREPASEFSHELFSRWMWLLHKPICNTENMLRVFREVPIIDTPYHIPFHYVAASVYGATYDPEFKAVWNRGRTGLHRTAAHTIDTGRHWIADHGRAFVQKIKDSIQEGSQQ